MRTRSRHHGTFRSDLLFRLDVLPIDLPPLRKRKEDILVLLEYLVQWSALKADKALRRIDNQPSTYFNPTTGPGTSANSRMPSRDPLLKITATCFACSRPGCPMSAATDRHYNPCVSLLTVVGAANAISLRPL